MEIRTYLGIATAGEDNTQGYAPGAQHAFNLFLTQDEGAEPDLARVQATLSQEGWENVEVKKTGVVLSEQIEQSQEPFPTMYKKAMKDGSAFLIYVSSEEEKKEGED